MHCVSRCTGPVRSSPVRRHCVSAASRMSVTLAPHFIRTAPKSPEAVRTTGEVPSESGPA